MSDLQNKPVYGDPRRDMAHLTDAGLVQRVWTRDNAALCEEILARMSKLKIVSDEMASRALDTYDKELKSDKIEMRRMKKALRAALNAQ